MPLCQPCQLCHPCQGRHVRASLDAFEWFAWGGTPFALGPDTPGK